jgi:PilZ domain-containing protein
MSKLTAEAFQSIVKALRSDDSDSMSEKRSAPRVGLRTQVDIEVLPASFSGGVLDTFTAWLRDISADGIGIVTNQHLPRGAEFIASFRREREGTMRIQYSVAHCKTLSKGLYSIGARVEKTLDE